MPVIISTPFKLQSADPFGEIAADNPFFWLKMDDSTSTAVNDGSYIYDGTYLNSPLQQVSPLINAGGTSVNYNGSNQYVEISPNANNAFRFQQWTAEAWINTNSLSEARTIFHVGRFDINPYQGYAVIVDTNGEVYVQACPNSVWKVVPSVGMNIQPWTTTHIGVKFYGNNSIRFYKNGQFVSQATIDWLVGEHQVYTFKVGTGQTTGGALQYRFMGSMDNFVFFNTLLDDTRIQAHYNAMGINQSYVAPPTKQIFYGTGSVQTFVVPPGRTEVQIKAWGAGGGSGTWDATSDGGGGGYAEGTLAVTPGQTLDIYVGRQGTASSTGGPGGWPGGGKGGDGSFSNGGGGGGFSGVFPNGNYTTPYIVAGGGAGGGTDDSFPGGGLVDWYDLSTIHFSCGRLGSQVAGGIGGTIGTNYPVAGQSGSFLQGGAGANIGSGHGGGGGGSGYYGGGGGSAGTNAGTGGPGGGGSSYIDHASLSDKQTLYNANASSKYLAANEGDSDWISPYGRGGSTQTSNGNHGLVVVWF